MKGHALQSAVILYRKCYEFTHQHPLEEEDKYFDCQARNSYQTLKNLQEIDRLQIRGPFGTQGDSVLTFFFLGPMCMQCVSQHFAKRITSINSGEHNSITSINSGENIHFLQEQKYFN